ncbi:guanitoxin biosynthesis heme-dependent pre-guanitoxin N-hydroxylase GntA [Streptomyces sp. TRM64462]|uniref:guanitoxin biosynthesis heme-dependent pre-guanitoxin N-hydroxylase GntA n=1 Tax=Streptomyces sp. TRM64462 TaxID=2741726 RepID=UPI001586479E|nr:guanitoxin biosynthesis heme-dependent pre-guanitoxin N-hydroxylase GntA [Streptomyces sp. TRM64462]
MAADPSQTADPPQTADTVGPVEVTRERIAEFADAIGDPNPAYRCPEAARALGHTDVIAPPTFAVRLAAQAEALVLARHPLGHDYTSAVHLSQDYRHLRPIRSGDVLTAEARLVQAREAMDGALATVEVEVTAADGPVTVSTARVLSRERRTPYEALAEFVGRDDFVCLGAKAAVRRESLVHHHCGELGGEEGAAHTLTRLTEFLAAFEPSPRSFTSFVATFDSLPDITEETFEERVWRHLQTMHDEDSRHHAWSDLYDSDPASRRFAFSVAGHPLFVVGLHPGASRPSRRFGMPALVFNSHLQFNALGRDFFKLRKKIRQRDHTFHGSANPSLLTYRDEARHYSGRMTEPEWSCPFTPRQSPSVP